MKDSAIRIFDEASDIDVDAYVRFVTKPTRPVTRIRYVDQNGVEHLTEWGAMTVPAGCTIIYVEISPNAE